MRSAVANGVKVKGTALAFAVTLVRVGRVLWVHRSPVLESIAVGGLGI